MKFGDDAQILRFYIAGAFGEHWSVTIINYNTIPIIEKQAKGQGQHYQNLLYHLETNKSILNMLTGKKSVLEF